MNDFFHTLVYFSKYSEQFLINKKIGKILNKKGLAFASP